MFPLRFYGTIRPFYGPSFLRSTETNKDVLVCRNGKIRGTMERLCAAERLVSAVDAHKVVAVEAVVAVVDAHDRAATVER